jgi:hypothetical protein
LDMLHQYFLEFWIFDSHLPYLSSICFHYGNWICNEHQNYSSERLLIELGGALVWCFWCALRGQCLGLQPPV